MDNHQPATATDDQTMATLTVMATKNRNPSGPTTTGDELDVLTHGAVFISPGLRRDEAFEFKISEELKGLGIPYHIHPGDHQGLISRCRRRRYTMLVEKTVSLAKDGIESEKYRCEVLGIPSFGSIKSFKTRC